MGGYPVGYIRVSSRGQELDGTSMEGQEQQIRAYCEFRELGEPVILQDPGISGGISLHRRPGGERLTGLIAAGDVNAVIITKLDRGFRSASDCLNNVEEWEERRVALHILNLGGSTIDTSTPAGKFFITVMAGAAELEKNMIHERCKEGRKIRRAQGAVLGGIPYGWDVGRTEGRVRILTKNAREQGVINAVLGLTAQGWTTYRIAKEFNKAGTKTKRGGGWSPLQVQRIIEKHLRDAERADESTKQALDQEPHS